MGNFNAIVAAAPPPHSPQSSPSSSPSPSPVITPSQRFTPVEVSAIRKRFQELSHQRSYITKQEFKTILEEHVEFAMAETLFLECLFDAFDSNGDKTIDLNEFLRGLSIFLKGTPDEKMELSFRMYDYNKDGVISQKDVTRFLTALYSAMGNSSEQTEVHALTSRMFEDLDVNGDGELSLSEYKLSALKEPLILDFLDGLVVAKHA